MISQEAFEAAVLTISDTASRGGREDLSGAAAVRFLESQGFVVRVKDILPDERALISDRLRGLADASEVALILTTGGTGFGPRDVTPEATRDVIEREAPGLAEAMRRATAAKKPLALLSRSVTGLRGRTLIINLPGSPKGVEECLEVLSPVLRHGLDVLRGVVTRHDERPEAGGCS